MRQLIIIVNLLCIAASVRADINATPAAFAADLRMLIEQASHEPSAAEAVLRDVYAQRQYAPLWFSNQQATPQAVALLGLLRDAAAYGLRAGDYQGIELATQLSAQKLATQAATARFEIDLSQATLHFLHDLHYGRIDPRKANFNLQAARADDFNAAATLSNLATTSDVTAAVSKVEPQFLHYQLLKAALSRYRLLAMDPQLTQLPPMSRRSIKPGEPYQGASALRHLLLAEQDLAQSDMTAVNDDSLDPALVMALQRYQQRHGLQADGSLGKQTFSALTTPFAARAKQIELTLERWRWLPAPQAPLIVVNIPQFKLFAFQSTRDHEADLLRMDVIVGQAFTQTQTPVFLADLKYVVFRPYWDVPRSIVNREMLPAINKDASYLQRHHLELVRGQGDNSPVVPVTRAAIAQLAAGALRLRQQPGEDNALGAVKFMLPNSYNVYLHSTPAQHLFKQSKRTFSHGCIRVSDPTALADYVLRNASEEWRKDKIAAAMQGMPNQRVTLSKPIPVMIVYGTVMPNEAGQVQFFDDIYGYDEKLAQLLKLN